ncbi:sensor histidine kinase [Calothrix sp. UHCC 0171]|uniref:sensor histidine kinase n=1 Tax=Calothrix sp. UHCC 0171 TaxID=3110245 RepID=UPI002B208FEC|nr:ATP-binding protein [Calothrix sp. UHCC 0171]MEA5570943.1 ATP-binding protein [Calothrix sp. UHCC 0171]
MVDVDSHKTRWFQDIQAIVYQRPSYCIVVAVTLTLGLFIPQVVMNWRTYKNFHYISQQELRLQKLSDRITYLDEVLTMSARMNAATGNRIWEARYKQFESDLDAAIKESINLIPEVYSSQDAQQVDIANQKLVEMETRSFELVQKNQSQSALELLSSPEYQKQKQIYAQGVEQRNQQIQQILKLQTENYHQDLSLSFILMALTLSLLIPFWFLVLRILQTYLRDRNLALAKLETVNYELNLSIQQLQQAQKLIQDEKISSLTQMVAGIAHEINNPVSFIRGNLTHIQQYSQELMDIIDLYQQEVVPAPAIILDKFDEIDFDFISEDITKALQSMYVGTERIKEIVLGLRAFSCLDESQRKKIDIHSGLESTILLLQHHLQSLKIEVIREYSQLPLVDCYPSQLNQVFMSLIKNAIEAIEASKILKGQIIIRSQLYQPGWIRISIIDNGNGINPQIQTKVFEPFFTTKAIGSSKGLGLSIGHQIITRSHQGKLYFQSTQSTSGCEFVIEIPTQLA